MALHEQCVGASDEWYTPAYVFEAMGVRFSMDVASPGRDKTPWIPTGFFLTERGLQKPWFGLVWMNPPFGGRNAIAPWLDRFFAHGNGVALTPDRTSAPWWQTYAAKADAVLFVGKKIRFLRPDGSEGASPAQGTTLMASGPKGVAALQNAARAGLGLLLEPPASSGPTGSLGEGGVTSTPLNPADQATPPYVAAGANDRNILTQSPSILPTGEE